MKKNILLKSSLTFSMLLIIFIQNSFGKFLFPPNDSLYEHETLKGHKFMVNSNIGTPFIQTFLQSRLGAGQTVNLKIPAVTIDTQEVIQLRGDLIYTNLDIEYQQMIKDWMAFRVKLSIAGKLGTKPGALISEGVNAASGYELGWLFKLYQNKELALSGSLDVFNKSYTVIDLNRFIQGVIDSGRITPSNTLVNTHSTVRAGGSIRFAYAFNRTFGFTGNFNAQFGESIDLTDINKWYFEYGGIFDADLLPVQNVPLGFVLGFYHNSLPLTSEQIQSEPNNILFGINYTGKQDLNLGLEVNYQFYKPNNFDENIKFVNMSLNMRYFF
ncbi:MAG: hypothetical protein IPM38_15440 [Ignavibacteria bacterium]|nr:hypothetical protein [Ignavibacteria bacterium]